MKDLATERIWSAAHQPVCAPADWYRAYLATDRVTFHRSDGYIETRTEIAIVPEDSAEVRRVTVTNNGHETREIELTSYGEIVLAPPDADRAHPAFGNLFVETEWHEWCSAITATRRPRSAKEAAALVRARGGLGQGAGGRSDLRDRPRAVHRPRALHPRARRRSRWTARSRGPPARCSTPSSRSGPGCASIPGSRRRSRSRRWSPPPASAPSSWPIAITTRTRRSARSTWPGPRARSSCASCSSRRPTPRCSRSSPATSSTAARRSGHRRRSSAATAARSRCSGPPASPATGRSCWPRSNRPTACRRCGSCWRRIATGADGA